MAGASSGRPAPGRLVECRRRAVTYVARPPGDADPGPRLLSIELVAATNEMVRHHYSRRGSVGLTRISTATPRASGTHPPPRGLSSQSPQHEEVEGALQQIERFIKHRFSPQRL
jgi:hypothetical protein